MAILSRPFTPAPGILIIDPELKQPTIVTSKEKTSTHLAQGKVVACGAPLVTEFGIKIPSPVKIGDTVFFLTYESGLDQLTYQGKTYHAVMFKDVRTVI